MPPANKLEYKPNATGCVSSFKCDFRRTNQGRGTYLYARATHHGLNPLLLTCGATTHTPATAAGDPYDDYRNYDTEAYEPYQLNDRTARAPPPPWNAQALAPPPGHNFSGHRRSRSPRPEPRNYYDRDAPPERSSRSPERFVSRDVLIEGFGGAVQDDDDVTPHPATTARHAPPQSHPPTSTSRVCICRFLWEQFR